MGYALNRAPLVYDRPSPANRGLLGLKHPCDRTRKLPEAGQLGASLRLTFTRVQRCAMPWAARDGHVPTMIHRSLVLMGGEPNTERADTELRASVRRLEKAQAWRQSSISDLVGFRRRATVPKGLERSPIRAAVGLGWTNRRDFGDGQAQCSVDGARAGHTSVQASRSTS